MTIIFAYTVYALNCPSLNCEFENKTCITDLYGLPYCVYSCSENISGNSIMKAVVGECSFDFKYCNSTTRELESNRCDLCGCPDVIYVDVLLVRYVLTKVEVTSVKTFVLTAPLKKNVLQFRLENGVL